MTLPAAQTRGPRMVPLRAPSLWAMTQSAGLLDMVGQVVMRSCHGPGRARVHHDIGALVAQLGHGGGQVVVQGLFAGRRIRVRVQRHAGELHGHASGQQRRPFLFVDGIGGRRDHA